MRTVLVVSYFFPPSGGVKVQRVLKFTKYLPSFGWKPIIITARRPQHDFLDYDLLREVSPDLRVERTFSFEPAKLYQLIRPAYGRLRNVFKRKDDPKPINMESYQELSWATKLNNFIFIPDNRIGWWPFAFFNILKNFKRDDFDLIYSTSPMFTSHLVGMAAKCIFGKPWVVDLRDLWVLNPYLKPPTKVHRNISRSIEHKTFKSADRIVTVADELRQGLVANYPEIPPDKFAVIPNGYDQADFESEKGQENDKFSIGYIGSLYLFSGRTPYYFLVALGELVAQSPQLAEEVEVTFIGPLDEQNKRILQGTILKCNLKNAVRQINPVSHREAIKRMRSFSLLLLILGKRIEKYKGGTDQLYDRTSVTGKLFEYLASGNPILALAEEGPAKRIIQETNSGWVIDPEDIQGIKRAILHFYTLHKEGKLKTQLGEEVLRRFERKKLTGKLADIFDELASGEQ